MEHEQWRHIPGYESKYEISSFGAVRSLYREQEFESRWGVANMKFPSKVLSISKNNNGYCYVTLSKNGVPKKYLLHRLVMSVFVMNSDLQVNHIDGDKTNNRLTNLEYVTPSENIRHSIDILGKKRGENNSCSKLTSEEVLLIRADNRYLREIAADYGVTLQAIHMIKKRKNWSHIL